jgi:hypothetical protein
MHSPTLQRILPIRQDLYLGRMQAEVPEQGPGNRPVSMITQRQVKPGCEVVFSHALQEFVAYAQGFPGHWGVRVLTRIRGGRKFFAVVDRFANSAARCAFTSSPEFGLWLSVLRSHTLEIPDLRERETSQRSYPTTQIETDRSAELLHRRNFYCRLQALGLRFVPFIRKAKRWLLEDR